VGRRGIEQARRGSENSIRSLHFESHRLRVTGVNEAHAVKHIATEDASVDLSHVFGAIGDEGSYAELIKLTEFVVAKDYDRGFVIARSTASNTQGRRAMNQMRAVEPHPVRIDRHQYASLGACIDYERAPSPGILRLVGKGELALNIRPSRRVTEPSVYHRVKL
jgi:hypothetical protein